MNICIVGAGYVGLVTGLCFADRGHRVTCVDVDRAKIEQLANGVLPLHEPGLAVLLERFLGERFFPTTDLTTAVEESELTMITVGTPLANGAISLRFVEAAAAAIGEALASTSDYHTVVVKSTVVPGTTDDCVRRILEDTSGKRCGVDFGVGMNPEFLREGEAVSDFQNPDRIVLGAGDRRAHEAMARMYVGFRDARQIFTNTRTAEMIKYASNAMLATFISFSNEIANLCSVARDVDVVDVLGAVHLDRRLTSVAQDGSIVTPGIVGYLKAGCGFGGSCFPKDVRALVHWGTENSRPTPLLSAVLETNDNQSREVVALLKRHFPVFTGLRVAVLGLAFKSGTDDIRESPALRVIPSLAADGAQVIAYDPLANEQTRRVLGDLRIQYAESLAAAVQAVDAIILLTAWPEFQQLPELLERAENPAVVVDGRRALDKARVRRYEGIGIGGTWERPTLAGAHLGV